MQEADMYTTLSCYLSSGAGRKGKCQRIQLMNRHAWQQSSGPGSIGFTTAAPLLLTISGSPIDVVEPYLYL